jgi:hypothetical protein
MKKLLLIIAVVSLSVLTFGQTKQTTTTTTKTKADTTKVMHKKAGTATDKAATKTVAPKDMNKAKTDTTKVKK